MHPNATAAAVTGGLGTLTVYLLNKYAGTHLDPAAAAGIATGLATIRLWVGRRGVKAALASIWHGSPAPTPAPPPPPGPPTV